MAADLGRKLLSEVEEVGLDEVRDGTKRRSARVDPFPQILTQLRLQQDSRPTYLGFEPIDDLIRQISEIGELSLSSAPFIEVSSLASGQGKTHLLYHLTAVAILPTYLGGQQSTVVLFDTNNTISVSRMATQIRLVAKPNSRSSLSPSDLESITLTSLQHVHIFRPQTLASLLATLDSLPAYLFDPKAHHSSDRKPGFIALDSLTTFYWSARAASDTNANPADNTHLFQYPAPGSSTTTVPATKPPSPATTLYNTLATSLQSASRTLGNCPIIYTAQSLSLIPTNASTTNAYLSTPRSLRVGIPGVLGESYTPATDANTARAVANRKEGPPPTILRLILHRTPIRPFPVRFSVEEALREKNDRQKAVEEGRFEVVINEWGSGEGEERRRIRGGEMSGFGFRIKDEGVLFDAEEEVSDEGMAT